MRNTLLGAILLVAGLAWGFLAWLLWSYVPSHAALFAALGTPLPRSATLAVRAAQWFIRLLPLLALLGLVLGRLVLMPLLAGATQKHERGASGALTILLCLAALAGLMASAFVVHAMRAGCSQASADPRYRQELEELRAAGRHPCSVN